MFWPYTLRGNKLIEFAANNSLAIKPKESNFPFELGFNKLNCGPQGWYSVRFTS